MTEAKAFQANEKEPSSSDSSRSVLSLAAHEIAGAFVSEESSTRTNIERHVTDFVKAVPLFIGGSRGLILSSIVFGVDEVKTDHAFFSGSTVAEAGFGLAKGFVTKSVFDAVGSKDWGFLRKGWALGASSRFIDTTLTPANYVTDGHIDILGGIKKGAINAGDLQALGVDALTFGTCAALPGFLGRTAPTASPTALASLVGGSFGFASGVLGETQHQLHEGKTNVSDILAAGAVGAGEMAAAAALGHKLTKSPVTSSNSEVNKSHNETAITPQTNIQSRNSASLVSEPGNRNISVSVRVNEPFIGMHDHWSFGAQGRGSLMRKGAYLHEADARIEEPARTTEETGRRKESSATKSEALRQLGSIFPKDSALLRHVSNMGDSVLDRFAFGDLCDFVSTNPEKRALLIEDELKRGGDEDWRVQARRFAGLERLQANFGESNPILQRILELENSYSFNLSDLAKYVDENPAKRMEFITKVLNDGGTASDLASYKIAPLERLHDLFPGKPDVVAHLRSLDTPGSTANMFSLVSFIAKDPEARTQRLAEMVHRKENSAAFSTHRLEALCRIESTFGRDSATVANIILAETNRTSFGTSAVEAVAHFIAERPERGPELVQRLAVDGVNAEDLTFAKLCLRDSMKHFAGCDETTIARALNSLSEYELPEIIKLIESHAIDAASIEKSLDKAAGTGGDVTKDMLEEQGNLDRLVETKGKHLPGLLSLTPGLVERGFTAQGLEKLANFVEGEHAFGVVYYGDESSRQSTLERQLSRLTTTTSPEELELRFYLEHHLLAGSKARKVFEDAEATNAISWPALMKFIEIKPDEKVQLIRGMIEATANVPEAKTLHLDQHRIELLSKLSEQTGCDQLHGFGRLEKLLKLEAAGLNLSQLKLLFYGETETQRRSRSALLKQMVDNDAPISHFGYLEFELRNALRRQYADDPNTADKIYNFGTKCQDIDEITKYLERNEKGDPPYSKKIETLLILIDNDAPHSVFNLTAMRDFSKIVSALGGPDGKVERRLVDLCKEGIYLNQAAEFVGRSSADKNIFGNLLRSGATAGDLTPPEMLAQVDLRFLASRLGERRMSDIASMTQDRSWLSRLRNYVEESPIARTKVLKQLIDTKADQKTLTQQMALSMLPEFVARAALDATVNGGMPVRQIVGHLKNWSYGERFGQLLTEQVRHGESLSLSAMEHLVSRARLSEPLHSNLSESFLATNPNNAAAKTVNSAVKDMLAAIPRERQMVVLGRDMWTLLPQLRVARPDTQYFFWSALQSDINTKRQWLREVPAGVAVIDTGFNGTILDKIRAIDPSATGHMLSSNGSKYPRLITTEDFRERVDEIEGLPKPFGRTIAHSETGIAISSYANRDKFDAVKRRNAISQLDRWTVERQSRELFKDMGLPAWTAWRYSQFSGLTPAERLGLSSATEVDRHYAAVARQRQGYGFETEGWQVAAE